MNDQPKNISTPPSVVGFISLGCPKNLIDSERMLADLALEGFVITGDMDVADIAVVNTCAFIEPARKESDEVIGELIDRKRRNELQIVIVAGCYPQKFKDEILDKWPDVDAVIGLAARERIGQIVRQIVTRRSDSPLQVVSACGDAPLTDRQRLRVTPRHMAYIRVSEGCNNCCAYCTIPQIRGSLRSKPFDEIIDEAREMLDDGTHELIIIGQDTTAYGNDLGDGSNIVKVLRELDRLDGLHWLRLLYAHPAHVTDELIAAYGEIEHLVPYVDLPLQHINQKIMDRMGRRTTRRRIDEIVAGLRRVRSDIAIRTTFIVGFPGETDQDFDELMDYVRQTRFTRMGAFAYSAEPGTPAAKMPGQVSRAVTKERLDALMSLQQEISLQMHDELVGQEVEVVIDQGSHGRQPGVGRIWSQAPDVDGLTHVSSRKPLKAGSIVRATVTAAGAYDLEARVEKR